MARHPETQNRQSDHERVLETAPQPPPQRGPLFHHLEKIALAIGMIGLMAAGVIIELLRDRESILKALLTGDLTLINLALLCIMGSVVVCMLRTVIKLDDSISRQGTRAATQNGLDEIRHQHCADLDKLSAKLDGIVETLRDIAAEVEAIGAAGDTAEDQIATLKRSVTELRQDVLHLPERSDQTAKHRSEQLLQEVASLHHSVADLSEKLDRQRKLQRFVVKAVMAHVEARAAAAAPRDGAPLDPSTGKDLGGLLRALHLTPAETADD